MSDAAAEALRQGVDEFWERMGADLTAYAHHAGRKTISEQDIELLMNRQGVITENSPLSAVARKFLPTDMAAKIIPAMMADQKLSIRPWGQPK